MLPQVGRLIRWPGGAGKYMMDNVDRMDRMDLMDPMDRMDGMGQSKNGKRVRTGKDIMLKHGIHRSMLRIMWC
jgi:hypothetical protein